MKKPVLDMPFVSIALLILLMISDSSIPSLRSMTISLSIP